MNATTRPIYVIAAEIRQSWLRPDPDAVPYIEAMASLDAIADQYGFTGASKIVCYFLANASTWKGATARRIKRELNSFFA